MPLGRKAGRNSRLYVDVSPNASGSAQPIAALQTLVIQRSSDSYDVTTFGDLNKVFVGGLPNAQITFDGFLDDTDTSFVRIFGDGLPRRAYLYADITNPGAQPYWFGLGFLSGNVHTDVGAAIKISGGKLDPTSAIVQVG